MGHSDKGFFSVRENYAWFGIFLFPLSFFIFTPFGIFLCIFLFKENLSYFYRAVVVFPTKAYHKDDLISLIPPCFPWF